MSSRTRVPKAELTGVYAAAVVMRSVDHHGTSTRAGR